MRHKWIWASLLLVALVASGKVRHLSAAPPEGYIVVLKDDALNAPAVAADHARNFGVGLRHVYSHALKGYAAVIAPERLADVQNDPRVLFVSADRPVWTMAQTLPTGVDRIEGQSSSGFASGVSGIAVAVIDTGSGPHPDLNIVGGKNCSAGKSFNDGNGHGTHVAGTIGAFNNANGVVGMAPGIPIYSVRVLNNAGSGSWASVICGIDWVTANANANPSWPIKVANMSLGGGGSDDGHCGNTDGDALHKAICNSVAAGITYVVAAGNSNSDFSSFAPAAYKEVLTVTAMADFNGQAGGGAAATCRSDVDDTSADFSNFTTAGSSDVIHTIAAPGVCITSTWKNGGYNTISGTSMATPHVTGTAALCIAGPCAGMAPSLVIEKLRSDAAARPAAYGFLGAPSNPITTGGAVPKTLFYGDLIYAGAY